MTYTPEERQAAAEKLTSVQEANHCNPSVYSIGGYGYEAWAIDLQCDLTRTQKQLAEARAMIVEYENVRAGRTKLFPDFYSVSRFLEATRLSSPSHCYPKVSCDPY